MDFLTRGVVITAEDLTLDNWPDRAKMAGLTTVALHPFPETLREFVQTDRGRSFLTRCEELGLEVEYELHAMNEFLPRHLFSSEPELFRMDDEGNRMPDANLCVHSEQAVDIVCKNAVSISRSLRPTTDRYFYWGDDGQPWCSCPACREYSDSDQALILENRILQAIREVNPNARLAHLVYINTSEPPSVIKPDPGIFLEFAPIRRSYDVPYSRQSGPSYQDGLANLDSNLEIFGTEGAQVLEYWLDSSRFSNWGKPAVRIPWNQQVFLSDLRSYASRGIRHVTSFAAYIDADYVARHGDPPLEDYGDGFRQVTQ